METLHYSVNGIKQKKFLRFTDFYFRHTPILKYTRTYYNTNIYVKVPTFLPIHINAVTGCKISDNRKYSRFNTDEYEVVECFMWPKEAMEVIENEDKLFDETTYIGIEKHEDFYVRFLFVPCVFKPSFKHLLPFVKLPCEI